MLAERCLHCERLTASRWLQGNTKTRHVCRGSHKDRSNAQHSQQVLMDSPCHSVPPRCRPTVSGTDDAVAGMPTTPLKHCGRACAAQHPPHATMCATITSPYPSPCSKTAWPGHSRHTHSTEPGGCLRGGAYTVHCMACHTVHLTGAACTSTAVTGHEDPC